ncbi:MAG: hypothetical protein AAF694_20120 [Bacteroidota bacterium]
MFFIQSHKNSGTFIFEIPMLYSLYGHSSTVFQLILASILLQLGMSSCKTATQPASERPPNILFILADDHTTQAISA